MDFPLYSAAFAVFSIGTYALLDGFDLGVGTLLLLQRDEKARDRMIAAIMPTWDGNETWLIMAGIELFAGFPTAYGVLLPALYVPLIAMLLALGLRGVSFEFRYQTTKARRWWDRLFAFGSILAAFAQGACVGGLISGVATGQGAFIGGPFDWFNAFSVLFGFTSLTGYALLGAGWLHFKGQGQTRVFAQQSLAWIAPIFLLAASATCLAAARIQPQLAGVWSRHASFILTLAAIILSTGILIAWRARSPGFRFDAEPFAGSLILFASALTGLFLTFIPDVVPFRISIRTASSPASTQAFLLLGALFVVPVIIGYSSFSYWVFRGKTPAKGWGE